MITLPLEVIGYTCSGYLQILPFGLHYGGKHCGGCFLYSTRTSFEALAPEIAKCGITKVVISACIIFLRIYTCIHI